jgi:hypothetical protein
LAQRYKVGRETIVRRLLVLGLTTSAFYRQKRRQYQEEAKRREQERQRGKGGPAPHRVAIGAAGPLFARLVLNGYHQERITVSDLSEYLQIRVKHLPKLEGALLGARSPW